MSIFSENMTSTEARIALFNAVKGKDKSERDRIFAEYEKVVPAIVHKELHEHDEDGLWLTSYH